MSTWRAVVSKKPLRAGEAFILRDDTFVMKIYRDSVTDPFRFAKWIAEQMNKLEEKQMAAQFELAELQRNPGVPRSQCDVAGHEWKEVSGIGCDLEEQCQVCKETRR